VALAATPSNDISLTPLKTPLPEANNQVGVISLIWQEFSVYGADIAQKALLVAKCESSLDPLARNASSSAVSIYQILKGTFTHYGCIGDRENPQDNIRCAARIYRATKSFKDWDASKQCWQ